MPMEKVFPLWDDAAQLEGFKGGASLEWYDMIFRASLRISGFNSKQACLPPAFGTSDAALGSVRIANSAAGRENLKRI